MAHKNYGGVAHTNTGYTNHTNVNSGGNGYAQNHQQYHQHYHNHTNYGEYHQAGGYAQSGYSVYNQYLNSYSNHGNYTESGGCRRDARESVYDILKKNKIVNFVDFPSTIAHYQYGYAAYRQYSNAYSNHTNYGNHTNYTDYHQAGYSNGYTQAYGQYNQSSGYNNHTNSGYTNHVNTTTNIAPGNVANVSRGSSAYYKSTIALTWTAATDNNKVISVVSRNTGSGGHADNGIWENTVQKQAAVRSWAGAYWNENGTYGGSIGCDVYGDAAQATNFINWLNSVNSVAKRYIAILGFDEPYTNASAIIDQLKSWGFSTLSAADTPHFIFVGIAQTGVGIKSQQTVRRYGTSDVRAASCFFTIPGVNSGQTITYYIDYAFKPIGGSYGDWTRIVNGHTTNSYNYSLASHGNGHIKFRVLSSDGVENGSTWVESSEVRVLKYDAPAFSTTSSGNIADDADGELVRVEINKLCIATGQTQATSAITAAKVMSKTDITDLRDKIKSVGTAISKTNITDTNLDLIRPADLQNIKNWIKTV